LDAFVDSAHLLDDGGALADRMREDGYLCVKGLLPRGDVLRVRNRFLEAAAAAGWLQAGTPAGEAIADPAKACVDPEAPFVAVLRQFYRHEQGHALKLHPNVIGLFERLFGEPVLAHPLLIPRCIFPQRPEFTTPSHQDFPHIQGTTETMSLWLPLGDCPAEMGGLAIARGSHQDGVRDFTVSNGAGAMEVIDPLEGSWVAGPLAAGDVLIFHSLTVHKGLPNLTDRLRISLDNRYQRANEPVCERCLQPYAGCGTWDEIYAGWQAADLKYYWRKQAPKIAAFDMQYYDKRDQIAFDLAEHGDHTARATLLRIVQRDPSEQKRARASALLARLDPQAAQPSLQ
jgi:ectoine hydroxylase-related dioxygenase (phytanoyl-CoA dioxygenase family)